MTTGVYPNPVHSANVLGKVDHQISGTDQFSVRYSLYRVTSDNSRGAGALNAPSASAGLDNIDHSAAFGNTWTLSQRTVNETRAQVSYGDLEAPPTDPVGPAVSIAGVASFGTLSGSPTRRKNTMYQVIDNISHQAGAHALRAGVDAVFNDDTITYPRSSRGSYSFASLANFLDRRLQRIHPDFRRPGGFADEPQCRHVRAGRMAGRRAADDEPGPPLRPAIPAADQHRYEQPLAACRLGVVAVGVARPASFAEMPGSSSTGFRSAPPPTRFSRPGTRPTLRGCSSRACQGSFPRRTERPCFPQFCPPRLLTTTLVDFTTMDRNLQNAYSKQASLEVERALGGGRTVSVGYQYLRGENLLMSVNQNVPTCVAAGTNNGCRPDAAYRNNSQYSSAGDSTYHGLHVSFVQRPSHWASVRVTYTLSKSMNDVGEAFFSSPIDPTDIMRDWGRSDDDQRHRLVVNGTVNTPMSPATTAWERISHGFRVSSMLQYYSALPFNVTSGVANLQGTTSRPLADGSRSDPNFDVRAVQFIPRNSGVGSDFFTLNLRVSRAFRLAGDVKLEALVETFNVTDRVNNLTRNNTFGPGAYPASPVSTFNQITAVGDPRTIQFGVRLTF